MLTSFNQAEMTMARREEKENRAYLDPRLERQERTGSMSMLIILTLLLFGVVASISYVPEQHQQPMVIALLAFLAVIGIVGLYASAIGVLKIARSRPAHADFAIEILNRRPEGILITDSEARPLFANEAYRLLTASLDEAVPPSLERSLATNPEVVEALYRLNRAARDNRPWQEEVRLRARPGQEEEEGVWLKIGVEGFSLPEIGDELTLWSVSDVSADREQQENVFRELQDAIDYLDHAPAGFFSADNEGNVRYMNATLADWLDYDLAQKAGLALRLSDILPRDAIAMLEGVTPKPGHPVTKVFDVDLQQRNAKALPVRLLHRVSFDEDGNRSASRTLVLNRSGKEDEAADLRAVEVRFARFFNNAPMAIATLNREGEVVRHNAGFARLFRTSVEEDKRARLVSLLKEKEGQPLGRIVAEASSGKAVIEPMDVDILPPEGKHDDERSARIFFSSFGEGDEEVAAIYAIDTTEQRALEAQFAQSSKMNAIGHLAGGLAHDFNNLLTAIIGFADLLLTTHRPTDPSFQDIMQIKQNASRAAGLVRQLLAFSRRQTLRLQVLKLNDVLSDLTVLLERLIGAKVKLDVQLGRDLWLVKADINQFEQVVINLAVNARDAMPSGGTLTVRTRNLTAEDVQKSAHKAMLGGEVTEFVLIEVEDTGTGMSREIMEKIFEPFFSTKDVGKGTGLGLSTVYGIVKQTGGFIYVDSELGKGTTFRIYLPRHVPAEAEKDVAKVVDKRSTDLTGSGTILLVEDEEAVRTFAARALKSRGYEVIEAPTGVAALEVMAERGGAVDLVVSDVVMPEMDGPTLLRELRKANPDVKIIFISGYAEEAFRKNLQAGEEFVFLPKPFSLKQLAEAVKNTMPSRAEAD